MYVLLFAFSIFVETLARKSSGAEACYQRLKLNSCISRATCKKLKRFVPCDCADTIWVNSPLSSIVTITTKSGKTAQQHSTV